VFVKRIDYKWAVGLVFVLGMFMDLLDSTIVNVALPTLSRTFHAPPTTVEWVVTGYLLALGVSIPVSGWAGDRFGTKRVFMFALTLFTIGSALAAEAWSIESLIAFRVLQGVGGGMLTPVGTAMLFRAFPPAERAKAAVILNIPIVLAPASGPILGGYLTQYYSWPWIFRINIPVGIIGLIVAGLLLKEHKEERPGRLDVPGLVLSTAAMASLLYALAEAGARGFGDSRVMLFGLVGLAALTAFAAVELRTKEPMIDLRLLGDRMFRTANGVQMVAFAAFAGALFLVPMLLQLEMGLSPFQSGLTTFPMALGVMSMSQFSGRIYGRVGPRRMMVTGLIGASFSTLLLMTVDLETSQWWIRLFMFVRGLSFALLLVPLQAATFATIRTEDMGRASSIYSSARQVAMSFGVALMATVLSSRLAHYGATLGDPATAQRSLQAFHDGFIAATVLALVGAAAALLFIRDKDAASTMPTRIEDFAPAEGEAVPAGGGSS
jgi:EmrB/QacA subfamily drug resistance transporter